MARLRMRGTAPIEVMVLISFEISMGGMGGIMNLCIPYNTIEPLAGKLSANTWSTYSQKQPDRRQTLNLETGVSNAGVEMVVYLAATRLTAGPPNWPADCPARFTPARHPYPPESGAAGGPQHHGFPALINR